MRAALLVCVAVLSAVFAGTASAQTSCTPTLSSGGPDGPTPPMRAKIGTGHVLTGVVLSPACRPIRGALVSFRQANAKGVYTPAGTGAVKTNRAGRFRFEGPRPREYGGRPGHIHIKVEADGYVTLYATYFPGGARSGSVRLVLVPSDL
jgi:protocatechuate 3,4-dioxygenase beta subunit